MLRRLRDKAAWILVILMAAGGIYATVEALRLRTLARSLGLENSSLRGIETELRGSLAAVGAAAAPLLDEAALGQEHALSGSEIAAGVPTLETPTLGIAADALTSDELTAAAPLLDAPELGQIHGLTATPITAGVPILGTPQLLGYIEEIFVDAIFTRELSADAVMTREIETEASL